MNRGSAGCFEYSKSSLHFLLNKKCRLLYYRVYAILFREENQRPWQQIVLRGGQQTNKHAEN